ncbi:MULTISPECIES: hypothetical protein [unclassified Actinomyces]|uniref:hypothetical protein n=1 Tax=unclassified Actinomyces TaxID=2609248 RepID=UPI002017B4BF|nr:MULTISPECIES: hypothetical protein [unclassified Actinomyces]MCL3778072.1 hypothetical protein [Actinomyces sp. AC-20-1]MCL3790493.1 hypothetical protein [Actinomyces sp. 187325]MCL3792774.1 hypothetical protein [Actinomyces sp. 186855]MCL3795243.1 hypothetical protein [Actinomyces sp. 217892]
MMRTLLAEELRTLGTVHAKTVGVLLVAGAGALAVGLVPNAMGADVPTLMAIAGAAVAFALPAPIILVHGLTEYWQSVHGQRGYLTMSLPARGREVFAAKVLYLLAAAVTALAITVAGLTLVVLVRSWMDGTSPAQVRDQALALLDLVGPAMTWTVLGAAVLQVLCWVVMWAGVMSIAAQTRWNHLGVTGVVIGMVLVYLVCQVLYAAAMVLLPLGIDLSTGELVARSMLPDLLRDASDPTVLGLGFVPVAVLISAVLAWWAIHCLEHHASLR